jgi:hypothetical protein
MRRLGRVLAAASHGSLVHAGLLGGGEAIKPV